MSWPPSAGGSATHHQAQNPPCHPWRSWPTLRGLTSLPLVQDQARLLELDHQRGPGHWDELESVGSTMMFYLSKFVWFLLQPSGSLTLILMCGTALLWSRWHRLARRLVTFAAIGFVVAGVSPVGNALLLPLEERFSRSQEDGEKDTIDGIVVLGGAVDPFVTQERGVVALHNSAERMTASVALAKHYKNARVVFAGGNASILRSGMTKAAAAEVFFTQQGVALERLAFEDRSRNTFENATNVKKLLNPKPGERWLLVTSASHMPRAMGSFRRAGFSVEAWPVDYRTAGYRSILQVFSKPSEGLYRVDVAFKEWVGLLAYRLLGRTDAVFPGP